jgi:hypothetical protein
MTLRIRSATLTFAYPFGLAGLEQMQPAGDYTVQTDDEQIEGISFLAYRRLATVILLPLPGRGAGSFQAIPVSPQELEAAQARDREPR